MKNIRDKKYLIFLHTQPCIFCQTGIQDETVVGHHIKTCTDGGMGLKPSDCYAVPLCHRHHTGEENIHGKEEEKFLEYGFHIEPKEVALTMYNKYKECKK